MAATFADVPLLLDTPEHAGFVDAFHDLGLLRSAVLDGYAGDGTGALPLPPEPDDGPVRVGVLRWPTGASRCGTFHALVDGDRLAAIVDAVGDGAGELALSDGVDGHEIAAQMYALPALPIHDILGRDAGEKLYLLTLVDQRFRWRWRSASVTSRPASWAALFSALATGLGVTVTTDTVDADYDTPSDRWVQYNKPLPALLDAAAAAVGHRVVVALDGTVTTARWGTATAAADAQWEDARKLVGGEVSAEDLVRSAPASVVVVFGKAVGGVPAADPYTVTKTLASLAVPGYGAATGIAGLTATAYSDYVYTATTASVAAAAAAATQTAYDWYGWRLCGIDATLPGIIAWSPTGAEDAVEWTYQLERLLTRVVRGPWQTLPPGGYATGLPDRPPLVRVVSATTGAGEYANRYTVRQVEVTGAGGTRDLADVVVDSGSVEWSDVVEVEDRLVAVSAAATPEDGVYTLFTAPDGQRYIDADAGVAVFPAELTSAYSSGYSWKRKTVASGTWADYSPSQTGTNNAYTPDDNQGLASSTRGVIFADGARYVFVPVILERTHCVGGYWHRQTSIDGGTTWVDDPDGPQDPAVACGTDPDTGCSGLGPDVFADLLEEECLYLTVLSASGFCGGIDTDQAMYLRWDTDRWVSKVWDPDTETWVDENFVTDLDASPIQFYYDEGWPKLRISGVPYWLAWRCSGDNGMVFSGSTAAVCDGTPPTLPAGACADNSFVVKLECTCCPIDGWQGPGWYWVVASGEDCYEDEGEAVELLEEDKCDETVVICCGPYETEQSATEACGPGGTIACSGDCTSEVLRRTLYAVVSGGNGTLTLTWDAGNSRWSGSAALACGETLYLRFGTACGLDFSCNGTDWGGATSAGTEDCSAAFVSRTYTANMENTLAGCAVGSCGSVDIVIYEALP